MKIIGMKLVYVAPDEQSGIVELILIPRNIVRKKPISILELANGSIDDIIHNTEGTQRFETKIYMDLTMYLEEIKNQPLSDIWLELYIDNFASDIVKTGVKKK
jgi:hypothetical protein